MESFIHADIFFFITSVVAVLFGIVLIVASFYVVRILRSVRYVVDKIKEESDNVSEDIAELRGRVKEGGVKFSGIARTLGAFFMGRASKHRRKKSDEE